MGSRHRTRRSFIVVLAALGALAGVAAFNAGCGSGGLGLTGGSIPIGTASVKGRAVRADDMSSPVANAAVVLSIGHVSGQTATDSAGRFTFDKIAGGTYVCSIIPPAGSGLRQWQYALPVDDGTPAQLIAGILPDNIDPSTIFGVRILPAQAAIHVGETVHLSAQALDRFGAALGVGGSLLVVGNVGDLDADGTFHATRTGTAIIYAWAGSQFASQRLTVLP